VRAFTLIPLLIAGGLVIVACSVDDGPGESTRPTTTTEATDRAETESTTTTTLTPSVGIVEVAGESHEIEATCYAPGAGEVLAVGVAATDAGRIEVYLQAFLGAPYLGISVMGDDTVVYEAAIDRPLDISYEGDVLRVDDIALVTDLDLESGTSVDAGVGSVVVECRAYEAELPSGFAAG
jgi:hypothetical protein